MVTWKHSGWVAVRYNWWKKWGAVAVMWREQPRYDLNNSPHNGSSQHGNPCPWTPLEQSPLYPKIKHAKCKHMENNEQIRVGKKLHLQQSRVSTYVRVSHKVLRKFKDSSTSMTNPKFSSLCHFSGGKMWYQTSQHPNHAEKIHQKMSWGRARRQSNTETSNWLVGDPGGQFLTSVKIIKHWIQSQ